MSPRAPARNPRSLLALILTLAACGCPPKPAAEPEAAAPIRAHAEATCRCATLPCADLELAELTALLGEQAGSEQTLAAVTRALECRARLAQPEDPVDMDGAIGEGEPVPVPPSGSGSGSDSGSSEDSAAD